MSEQRPPSTPQPCASCAGRKGQVVDTSSGGVIRQNWISCGPCNGTGVQGGGI
jgi:DnaJ-class molecular chaperone